MTRTELLDWTLEKNGLAEAMELLENSEKPTPAMAKAIDEMRDEQPVDFSWLLSLHPALQRAFYRLEMLDSNGASATASDIQDWVVSGELDASDAARFTDEINAACDALERNGN